MNSDTAIKKTITFVKQVFATDTTGHDIWHALRVHANAKVINAREKGDPVIVELAALLHDVEDFKFSSVKQVDSQLKVRNFLQSLPLNTATVEAIVQVIKEISFKGAGVDTTPSTGEGMIVQDADRLDGLGAIGIARCFTYGGSYQRPMHDPHIKPVLHADFNTYKETKGTSINHFYEKLLLLTDRMNTKTGKKMARSRHIFLEKFLKEFFLEWEGKK
jgi:uncharacterized protein